MYEVIVIGRDHYNPLSVIRSLGKAGFSPILILVKPDVKHSYISKTKYLSKCYMVASEDDMIDLLLTLSFPRKTLIIACNDRVASKLDNNYVLLSEKYYVPNCGGKQGELSSWMNKKRQQDAAKQAGLRIIESHVLNTHNWSEKDLEKIDFPCLLKPLYSNKATKDNFRICADLNNLIDAIKEIEETCNEIIIQKYLKVDYEYNILAARINNKKCWYPGAYYRIKACKDLNNMGMPCYGYFKTQHHPDIDMGAWLKFQDEVGYEGLFSTEFLISEDKAYFLEMNLRNDGDLFLWTKAGANLPAWLATTLYGQETVDVSHVKDIVYGMNEVNYIKYHVRFGNLLGNLKEWLRCSCYVILDWSDIKPLFYKILYKFK